MAKIDVLKEVSDSFRLIKEHYKEVAVLLFAIFFLQVIIGFSSRLAVNYLSLPLDDADALGKTVAQSMASASSLNSALFTLAIFAVILIFIFSILERALFFCACEHFYSLLCGKKPSTDWKSRIAHFSWKSFVLAVFNIIISLAFFALPLLALYSAFVSSDASAGIGLLLSAIPTLAIAALAYVALMFCLSLLFVYYAMDGLPFFDSISRSLMMVIGNLWVFFILFLVFFAFSLAASLISIAACCLSFLVFPLLGVFLGLLYGVTLMKIRLALDERNRPFPQAH